MHLAVASRGHVGYALSVVSQKIMDPNDGTELERLAVASRGHVGYALPVVPRKIVDPNDGTELGRLPSKITRWRVELKSFATSHS